MLVGTLLGTNDGADDGTSDGTTDGASHVGNFISTSNVSPLNDNNSNFGSVTEFASTNNIVP